jgi:hypothetical protein
MQADGRKGTTMEDVASAEDQRSASSVPQETPGGRPSVGVG